MGATRVLRRSCGPPRGDKEAYPEVEREVEALIHELKCLDFPLHLGIGLLVGVHMSVGGLE
eukprot:851360-Prorocentrum_minimum.AAC.1